MHRQLHDWLRRLPANVQGALWLVAGGFIFTATSAMIRLLSTQIESVQTAFFRAAISVVLLIPYMAAGRVNPWRSTRIAGHFWRTLMGTTSMVLGFYAVSMLPLADATAIAFSQPLFSVVVAAVIAREKVRWRRWSATIVGFVGVLVMVVSVIASESRGMKFALPQAHPAERTMYEAGKRIFTESDVDALGTIRADVLHKLFTVAQKLSGITEEDAEDLGKPLSPAVSGTSSSASRVN